MFTLSPAALTFITSLTLKLLDKFKHRNDVVTEDEIRAAAEEHYQEFLAKNQELQNETKPT